MPLQETSGAASYDAFGGGAISRVYIEDVFSTYLYIGNGSTQTITNGIDLAGKGGLVWIKCRSTGASNVLSDTVRGATKYLVSESASSQNTDANALTAFNANGFSIGSNGNFNINNQLFASWAFREQPKFFDMVTWTGNNVAGRQIPHSLASVPGCIIVKGYNLGIDWYVYHRGADVGNPAEYKRAYLNSTAAFSNTTAAWNDTAPTSTNFTVGTDLNNSNYTYVAYLFAHDAGGFGLSGTDSVVSCGKYVGNGTGSLNVTVGFEPQWLMVKDSSTTGNWVMVDTMRGLFTGGSTDRSLVANSSDAENNVLGTTPFIATNATGFTLEAATPLNNFGNTFVYIAIRRGPMKVPTTGTSVFSPNTYTSAQDTSITTGFPVDVQFIRQRNTATTENVIDRLRGTDTTLSGADARLLFTQSTSAESVSSSWARYWNSTGYRVATNPGAVLTSSWNFRRAAGFMDIVCYSGTGGAATKPHNLTVVPEMMIFKTRNDTDGWPVYHVATGNTGHTLLNQTFGFLTSTNFNNTTPTASVFSVGSNLNFNSSFNYVAYLFATCPGVSKVGSYTGTGTTLQVNCGFTAGARYVLIKRSDTTGSWYVWDSARGIVAGDDPYLLLNSTNAEVTNTDYVDTYSAGFEISSTAPAEINANGGTFIFLAIA